MGGKGTYEYDTGYEHGHEDGFEAGFEAGKEEAYSTPKARSDHALVESKKAKPRKRAAKARRRKS